MIYSLALMFLSACSNGPTDATAPEAGPARANSASERTFHIAFQANVDGEIEPCG